MREKPRAELHLIPGMEATLICKPTQCPFAPLNFLPSHLIFELKAIYSTLFFYKLLLLILILRKGGKANTRGKALIRFNP